MLNIGALLFDLDGTIVDNMNFHMLAWGEYLKANGVYDSEEKVFKNVVGKTTEESIKTYFGQGLTNGEIKEHCRQKEDLYKKMYLPHLKETPGIIELFKQARRLNIPMAIASAAGIGNVDFILDNLKIAHYFKVVVNANDVKHGKPDPEIFLLAARRLGVEPGACLVFEDSLAGLEAAENAGMKAVAITTGHSAEKLAQYPAVIKVVNHFLEFDLNTLIFQTVK